MSEIWISAIGIILGVIATIIVSHYYYKRSLRKSLTPFIQFFSTPLHGIDPTVRKDLLIEYQHDEIQELFEIQFLIANTGDKSIRDVIKPLSLAIPKDSNLLDATILHIHPDGREVKLKNLVESRTIQLDFPLLNSGDFFIIKLLLNKEVSHKEFIFSIVADELPPVLENSFLPSDALKTNEKRSFELPLLIIGIVFTIFGLSLAKVINNSLANLPNIKELGLLFFVKIGLDGWSIIFGCIPTLFMLMIGVVISIGSFTNFRFPPAKNTFVVPNDKQLLKNRDRFFSVER